MAPPWSCYPDGFGQRATLARKWLLVNTKSPPTNVGGDFCPLYLQLGHHFVVGFGVLTFEVLHEATTFADLFDQATA